MYKVIEERKEIEEAVNTVVYEYDYESLEGALSHIETRSSQDCKCYIGSDDKKSKYRRSLMELDKEELIEKLMNKDSKICGVKIRGDGYLPNEKIILGKCDLYITNDNKSYEKVNGVEVTVMS